MTVIARDCKSPRVFGVPRNQGLLDTITPAHRGSTETVEAYTEPAQVCTTQGPIAE